LSDILPATLPWYRENRYRVVFAACAIQAIIIGCMFSYGIYLKILEAELGWSRTLLSGSSSAAFLVMGVFAMVGGRLNDVYGPRWVLSVTGVLTGLGYLWMSQMTEPWQLLIAFGGLIGLGLSTHDVVTLSTVAAWYNKRRGAMTGLVKTGTACGQMTVPILVTFIIAAVGWRHSLLLMGFTVAVLLLLFAQWMQLPEQKKTSKGEAAPQKEGISYTSARRTRVFWTLCAIQFCFLPALITVPLHLPAHATDLGMSTVKAASVLGLIGGSSIAGRIGLGILQDRLGGRIALMCCLAPLAVTLLALLVIVNPTHLFWFAPVYGFSHGGLFTIVSPTVAEYFGLKSHGAIFGVIVFCGTLGGAAGPVLAGFQFDRLGSYASVFATLAVLALIGFALALTLRPLTVSAAHTHKLKT